jgi:hypothetical protein
LLEFSGGLVSTLGLAPTGIGVFIAALAVYLGGLGYWYWWLYRIHKILAEATNSKYPITPAKAVGYRLIPFFNLLFWNFRWTNQIADLVRQDPKQTPMRKGWLGAWLILATLLLFVDRGLSLVVLFCISVYLTRKIKALLPLALATFAASPFMAERMAYAAQDVGDANEQYVPLSNAAAPRVGDAWDFHLASLWGLPVSSGVGAAFGFLMCYGLWLNMREPESKLGTFALKTVVVAIVLYFFLEPLVDKLLEAFGAADQHLSRKVWQRMFRFTVFVAIVDVAHSLLERATEQGGGAEVAKFGILFTVFFGGITFLWIISCARTKLPEALLLVGVGTLVLVAFGGFVVSAAGNLSQKLGLPELKDEGLYAKAAHTFKDFPIDAVNQFQSGQIPAALRSLTHDVGAETGVLNATDETKSTSESADAGKPKNRESKNGVAKSIALPIELACAVFVAMAGFVAMRTTSRPVVVAGTVFGASVITGLILGFTPLIERQNRYHIVTALWSAFWWCLGILVFYDYELFGHSSEPRLDPHLEHDRDHELPRVVWLISFIILISLIVAARSYPPWGKKIGSPILTLQANDIWSRYGAKPTLTYSASGLLDGDAVEPTLNSQESILSGAPELYAPVDSHPGLYPIAIGLGNAKQNEEKYKLDFRTGTLTIEKARTQAKLTSSAATAVVNTPVNFTVSTSSIDGAGTPSGDIKLYAGATLLGISTLSNGTASWQVGGLGVGEHLITAKYSGDTNFLTSDSSPLTQQIRPIDYPPNALVIKSGTPIFVTNDAVIDSNTGKGADVITAMLDRPLVANNKVVAPKGAIAILGLSGIDPEGKYGARPTLYIHLVQIQIGDNYYRPLSILRMRGAPQGREGHIHIPAHTILQFELMSPLTINNSSLPPATTRTPARR